MNSTLRRRSKNIKYNINNIILRENLEDCITPQEKAKFYIVNNDIPVKNYCELAFHKLPLYGYNLEQNQIDDLNDIINEIFDTKINGWIAYFTTLTNKQTDIIGY